MRLDRSAWLLGTVGLALAVAVASGVQNDIGIPAAEVLFKAGKFIEADKVCEALVRNSSGGSDAALLKARIALLSNRLSDAEKWLTKARMLDPDRKETLPLLAEVF